MKDKKVKTKYIDIPLDTTTQIRMCKIIKKEIIKYNTSKNKVSCGSLGQILYIGSKFHLKVGINTRMNERGCQLFPNGEVMNDAFIEFETYSKNIRS